MPKKNQAVLITVRFSTYFCSTQQLFLPSPPFQAVLLKCVPLYQLFQKKRTVNFIFKELLEQRSTKRKRLYESSHKAETSCRVLLTEHQVVMKLNGLQSTIYAGILISLIIEEWNVFLIYNQYCVSCGNIIIDIIVHSRNDFVH